MTPVFNRSAIVLKNVVFPLPEEPGRKVKDVNKSVDCEFLLRCRSLTHDGPQTASDCAGNVLQELLLVSPTLRHRNIGKCDHRRGVIGDGWGVGAGTFRRGRFLPVASVIIIDVIVFESKNESYFTFYTTKIFHYGR